MGPDDIVIPSVVVARTLEDRLSDTPLIEVGPFSGHCLLANVQEKCGKAIGIDKAGTGDHSLNEQPTGIVLNRTRQAIPLSPSIANLWENSTAFDLQFQVLSMSGP
jgi:hypothetical protein